MCAYYESHMRYVSLKTEQINSIKKKNSDNLDNHSKLKTKKKTWLRTEEKSIISKPLFIARSINVGLENEWSSAFYSPIKSDERQKNVVKRKSQYKYLLGHGPYAFDYHYSCKLGKKNRKSEDFKPLYCLLLSEIRIFVHVENWNFQKP